MEDSLNVGIIWSIKHTPFWKHKNWRIEYDLTINNDDSFRMYTGTD